MVHTAMTERNAMNRINMNPSFRKLIEIYYSLKRFQNYLKCFEMSTRKENTNKNTHSFMRNKSNNI
jgi:hypothetical protein